MSRITNVEASVLMADLDSPWDFGIEPYAHSTAVLVKVTAESGEVGFGEAIARKSPKTTATLVEDLLAPFAIGRVVDDLGAIWLDCVNTLRRWGHSRGFLHEAVAGLDIALWDLRAREHGLSVGAFLPYGARGSVPVYGSSVYFQESVADAVKVAQDMEAQGFPDIKIKIGHRADQGGLERDIATVKEIRKGLRPETGTMLDANGAYSFAQARILVESLRDLGVIWLEEPFPPDDLTGYAALAAVSAVPLAAGESEFSVFGFRDLLKSNSLGFAQPDIARCGGFTGALQVVNFCYAMNIPVCPHTGFSGGINNLASLHLASTLPAEASLEFMTIGNPLRDMFVGGLPEPVNGRLEVPKGVGLGVDLDLDLVAKFVRD
jgi:L-alanine-DL-glutamate epimerase-like enolase superfamily enzyme